MERPALPRPEVDIGTDKPLVLNLDKSGNQTECNWAQLVPHDPGQIEILGLRLTNPEAQMRCLQEGGRELWQDLGSLDMMVKLLQQDQRLFDISRGPVILHTGIYFDSKTGHFYKQNGQRV